MKEHHDVVIVGSGLSGSVLAERIATTTTLHVLVLEKRDHIAGNCYDFVDDNGILMNQYGAHLFHTNDEEVWDYVNQFAEWRRWDHRVLGKVNGKLVPIPVNINTVNALCGTNIQSNGEMRTWLSDHQLCFETEPTNSREMALSRVGQELYEKIFRPYTIKQWGKEPEELGPSVLARIPVREDWDDRYFTDRFQALPVGGYTNFISRMLDHPHIEVRTCTDFFAVRDNIDWDHLFFTGPIDHYYSQMGLDKLEYRSLRFEVERHRNMNYYQPNSVVNHPSPDTPFTRIVEYKHFLHQSSPHTTIVKEYACDEGEPYYPVPNAKNTSLYEKYRSLSGNEKNVFFVGRLANYKYFNMDAAIRNALDLFQSVFSSFHKA